MMDEWVSELMNGGLLSKSSESFSLQSFLSSEAELLRWKAQGLPTYKLSFENAIVILKTDLTPLIIDPSSQAALILQLTLTFTPHPSSRPTPPLIQALTPTPLLILALTPTLLQPETSLSHSALP